MEYIQIIKGSSRTTVDEATFRKVYEPCGWRIDETMQPLNTAKSDRTILQIIKVNEHKKVVFTDDLFYSERKEIKDGV